MRLLVSGRIAFVELDKCGFTERNSSDNKKTMKTFTQNRIGYLCSAITNLTHNDPDTYIEIMRLCNEVNKRSFVLHVNSRILW